MHRLSFISLNTPTERAGKHSLIMLCDKIASMFNQIDEQLEDIENNCRTLSALNNDPFNIMKNMERSASLTRAFLPTDD